MQTLLREKQRRTEAARFETYAPANLRIRTKAGALEPLRLNRVQMFVHELVEKQRAETGKVRALVLKARQMGLSTYIAGRFYWKTSTQRGKRTYILTHEQDATNNLFEIAQRYYDHDPSRPQTRAANAKEMDFDELDSGYRVGTAGTKATGRSGTAQYFHGSEMAFWPNAKTHMAGVVQSIPNEPDTEIFLESTANGLGGEFHEQWQKAEKGEGDYIPIFVPWFWQHEYTREPPRGFRLNDEEAEYAQLHGCNVAQMCWRRAKIAELGGDEFLFAQEYPATAAEAFGLSAQKSYIKPALVLAARKARVDGVGPLILGVDPARYGDGRFAVCRRRGRRVMKVEARLGLSIPEGAAWVKSIIDAERPAAVFIDMGGLGAGTYDLLVGWGEKYEKIVSGVNFGGKPMDPIEYNDDQTRKPRGKNRRAEMWKRSKEWLETTGGVQIPDDDELQADANGPTYKYDLEQNLILESKEDMRNRGIRSPDKWDAVVLTFAEPVYAVTDSADRPNIKGRVRDERIGV